MRTLAFDGRAGVAGDVLLGTLVAAGADPAVLAPVTETLPVDYAFEAVSEQGIAATRARVLTTHEDDDHEHDGESHHDNGRHDHADDGHSHTHAEGSGPERTYDDVRAVLDGMSLSASVTETAREAFRLLGEAEAAVHDTDLGATPFHEVGADDAIADVVGAALLLADLGPERVVTTPVAAGGGEATFSHGTYPVPTPAVTEIAAAADWRLSGGPVDRELLTPTGAAILAAVADGVERLPALRVETSGYGAGGYDLGDRPNVLRAVVGGHPAAADRDSTGAGDHDHTDGRHAGHGDRHGHTGGHGGGDGLHGGRRGGVGDEPRRRDPGGARESPGDAPGGRGLRRDDPPDDGQEVPSRPPRDGGV
ncbi:MAG: hypothetical protein J07HB67_01148 [halophilic archaeon J07HB67]|jgi:Uncharacterized conserved protein|nr:MAG: hypothetical protein J07HB67_01148 [halophilic archaeon J07HB67]